MVIVFVFITSVALGLYGKPKLHFDICAAGITQMINPRSLEGGGSN